MRKITVFITENHSISKNIYVTNKTNVYHIDDTWSMHILNVNDYGPKNNKGYRLIIVVIDFFSKFEWTFPLKN